MPINNRSLYGAGDFAIDPQTGQKITADSPQVVSYMNQHPDYNLNPDVAIGNAMDDYYKNRSLTPPAMPQQQQPQIQQPQQQGPQQQNPSPQLSNTNGNNGNPTSNSGFDVNSIVNSTDPQARFNNILRAMLTVAQNPRYQDLYAKKNAIIQARYAAGNSLGTNSDLNAKLTPQDQLSLSNQEQGGLEKMLGGVNTGIETQRQVDDRTLTALRDAAHYGSYDQRTQQNALKMAIPNWSNLDPQTQQTLWEQSGMTGTAPTDLQSTAKKYVSYQTILDPKTNQSVLAGVTTDGQLEIINNPTTGSAAVRTTATTAAKTTGKGGGGSGKYTTKQLQQQMATTLGNVAGSDGHVSNENWNKLRGAWVAHGGSASSFDNNFKSYVDPTHSFDYQTNKTM